MSARTSIAHAPAAVVEREVAEHSAVRAGPEWQATADRAVALNDPSQAVEAPPS